MHTHQSLFRGDQNALPYDPDDEYFLSDVGKAFIAGPAAPRACARSARSSPSAG